MKQLKFLKTIALDGKPIWYEGCIYEVMGETDNMFKLISEDLQPRGIDKAIEGRMFTVIEVKQEEKKVEKEENKSENKLEEKPKIATKPRKTVKK